MLNKVVKGSVKDKACGQKVGLDTPKRETANRANSIVTPTHKRKAGLKVALAIPEKIEYNKMNYYK